MPASIDNYDIPFKLYDKCVNKWINSLGKTKLNDTCKELFKKTITKKTYKLYIGLSWESETEYSKFIKNYNVNDGILDIKKLSSFSYNLQIARMFATQNKYGVILEGIFDKNDVYADITKIKSDIWNTWGPFPKHLKEVIVFPNTYKLIIKEILEPAKKPSAKKPKKPKKPSKK